MSDDLTRIADALELIARAVVAADKRRQQAEVDAYNADLRAKLSGDTP